MHRGHAPETPLHWLLMDEERLDEIAARHDIRLMVKFGSTVTRRQHTSSDLDVAVLLERRPGMQEEMELYADLHEIFPGEDLDLAILNRADPLFLKQIMQSCELVWGEPRELYELKMLAFRRYQDHRRYLDLERRYVEQALQGVRS
jgi:uncharacterized protein